MAATEKKDITGLDIAAANTAKAEGTSMKSVEYDLTKALLSAAEFRHSDDAITEVEIRRGGNYCFTVRIRPISESESLKCRKKATTYMPNPNGRKLPAIEKEFNSSLFHSHLIVMATIPEDQEKIWKNQAVMEKYDILNPAETVDLLLAVGEKIDLVDTIMDISGLTPDLDGEEESDLEDYAKN